MLYGHDRCSRLIQLVFYLLKRGSDLLENRTKHIHMRSLLVHNNTCKFLQMHNYLEQNKILESVID